MEVLIQVNTSDEKSKFGVSPSAVAAFAKQVARFDTLQVKGLMTIGLFSTDIDKVHKCFRLLKSVQQQVAMLGLPGIEMRELSMGMSGDFEAAIAEGSTIVRVGTAIFGQRPTADSYYWNENDR